MLSFNRLLRVARARLGRALVGALESMADALRDAPPRARAALLALAWPSLLGALGLLLSKATHGTLIASLCVDTLVSLIATCASVGETASAPRDALVNALVKCADEEGLRKCAQVFFSSKKNHQKKRGRRETGCLYVGFVASVKSCSRSWSGFLVCRVGFVGASDAPSSGRGTGSSR